MQTALAPASTFKAVSTAAALEAGYSTTAAYDCPSSYSVGGRAFQNYRSRAFGPISLTRALEVSCDTVFYRLAHEQWRADGGSKPIEDPSDLIATTAADFGFGRATGIDLPGETAGRVASREAKAAQWEQRRDEWCARAKDGYPEVTDAERARYLTPPGEGELQGGHALAGRRCAQRLDRPGRYRGDRAAGGHRLRGDRQRRHALPTAGGACAAQRRRVGGRGVRPEEAGTVDVPAEDLAFLRRALRGVIDTGTARRPFAGFPLDEVPIAGKTGTGEVYGQQATSWFASFAPADDPRYAVVIMVSQGGTGAGTSAPA